MITDFVEPEDVHAIVMPSDFDITIAGSVPLIHNFYDVDPTLAPIKTSGRRSEICMRLDLNAHELTHGITRLRRSNFRACCPLHRVSLISGVHGSEPTTARRGFRVEREA